MSSAGRPFMLADAVAREFGRSRCCHQGDPGFLHISKRLFRCSVIHFVQPHTRQNEPILDHQIHKRDAGLSQTVQRDARKPSHRVTRNTDHKGFANRIAEISAQRSDVSEHGANRERNLGHSGAGNSVKTSSSPLVTDESARASPHNQSNRSKRERWMVEKAALKEKFGENGWQPRKRLSPDTLEGLRALHASDPTTYTTPVLAEHFRITPEAIRRILKSKWKPNAAEVEKRSQRWENRGLRKWEDMSSQGIKPPRRWRDMGADRIRTARSSKTADSGMSTHERFAEQSQDSPTSQPLSERIV